jgi:hypothetical protein
MVSTLLILAVAASALVMLWLLLAHSRQSADCSVADWEQNKSAIDIQIFRLLVDFNEERYLEISLSPYQFDAFQRRRIALALRIIARARENADMLIRLGSRAKTEDDAELVREADQLVATATQFRLNLMLARYCLWVRWIFPRWNMAIPKIEVRHQRMLDSLLRVQQHGWQA